ncbi:hypothetical protein PSACC_01101 [Paramicrosporidium saccamoebae]|uniref:Uncharacterized protein n=1 Tax=Paramicrosporidium saccamoebae TaxID=1246581 RepID=A0A2H9TMY2_9FUNG|nr:hypothetical protein PSACC_01101 [Paramicrosporidium saccamoebae]
MKLALLLLAAGCYAATPEDNISEKCKDAVEALSEDSVYHRIHENLISAQYKGREHQGLGASYGIIESYTKLMPERFDDEETAAEALPMFYNCRDDHVGKDATLKEKIKRDLFGQIPMFSDKAFKDEVIREFNDKEGEAVEWYKGFEIPTADVGEEL